MDTEATELPSIAGELGLGVWGTRPQPQRALL